MKRTEEWRFIEQALEGRRKENRFRTLHPLVPGSDGVTVEKEGKQLINFSSNDYLGLSGHSLLAERSSKFVEKYGAGAAASRMISGTYDIHDRLEQKIVSIFDSEAALVFNSGFQANSTIIQALTDRNSLVLADNLSHNSLLQGSLLSRGRLQRFEHNDIDHLEKLLEKASSKSYSRILILTETVFSMDGDRSDLDAIIRLSDEYGTLLFVDDAHAVGVWGENGLGLAYARNGIDITLGTFGKAFGVFGAFVTCSGKMRDYLINFCSGFIYTTALPPQVIGALDAAVDLVPGMNDERALYHKMIERVREEIHTIGFRTGDSSSQIIPIIIGSEKETLELSALLEENGILATAIRPPTVPEKGSRIRITLSCKHRENHIDRLTDALRKWEK